MGLKGAHLGEQNGLGSIYSANYIGSNSSAVQVRFAVVAATRGNVTVLMFAIDPADTKDFETGIPEGQAFDYVASEFTWT
jgi:hypothetical protein